MVPTHAERGLARPSRRGVLLAGAALGLCGAAPAKPTEPAPVRRITGAIAAPKSPFIIGCDHSGLTSLRYRGDRYDTDYVRAGAALGPVQARFRRGVGEWVALAPAGEAHSTASSLTAKATRDGVTLSSTLALEGNALAWRIELRNDSDSAVEVGDLALPLPMPTRFAAGHATEAVMKHSFVSGHGSHIFWMRSNSAGPYLLLLPERGTHLEYWERGGPEGEKPQTWSAFVHAAARLAEVRAAGGRWRQPPTALRLAPGEARTYGFRFLWVADYEAAREAIAQAGGIDLEVVPGMTVPSDLHVDLALRSADPVERIVAEFPSDTDVELMGTRDGRQYYRIRFRRLGENLLTLHQPDGRRTFLEFFATEPVERMMKKRAAFIVRRQHRDPAKWYDGLFGEWNMDSGTLLGPDNYDRIKGWRIYEVTCDDPGLSKPAYLATKNAEHPVAEEVAALDRYIEKFVWGGLQRTTQESYPYAIYGIPDWKQNRESADPGRKGRLHIWRPYDYPHIFTVYLAMHRIARDHPAIPTKLSARDYLMRAYGTAVAMFTVPLTIDGWSAYRTGFYNECVIPELIDALREAGSTREAATLEAHWARKVRWFVQNDADLFGSEYPFDSTGFESTQALARSAIDRPDAMGVTPAQARAFNGRQLAANLFCRGWLEPAYYYLGSDYRAQGGDAYTLTYMAQMGGWAVLDHALNDAPDPHPLLRLGYASQLSAWALLNSGSAESDHGYWYPGERNDGAAAGGFEPAAMGQTWLDQPHHRGAWYYSCEIDLGFCGAVRAAATILADDPVFGRTCYGGLCQPCDGGVAIIPRDGVRRRLGLRLDQTALDIVLLDARFAAEQPIELSEDGKRLVFAVEPFASGAERLIATMRAGQGEWGRHSVVVRDGRAELRI
jgi:hypothetical protein